jgi:hypothetical protein
MKLRRFWKSIAAALLVVVTMGATPTWAAPRGRIYVRIGPPAPFVEARAVPPGRRYVWVPGYHRWGGANYVWVPGTWRRPPRARAAWVPGRWAHDRRGWFFVQGHWR